MYTCALSPGPLRRLQLSNAYTLRRVYSVYVQYCRCTIIYTNYITEVTFSIIVLFTLGIAYSPEHSLGPGQTAQMAIWEKITWGMCRIHQIGNLKGVEWWKLCKLALSRGVLCSLSLPNTDIVPPLCHNNGAGWLNNSCGRGGGREKVLGPGHQG